MSFSTSFLFFNAITIFAFHMSESRIVDFDYASGIIHYYYEDYKTEERIEVEEHVVEFMKKLVQHIPESQFKMIRYCGLYATCDHTHKTAVEKLREKSRKPTRQKSYRKELIDTFDTYPLLCSCDTYMEYIDYWVPLSRRKDDDYEEEIPDWVYGEEALFLKEEGITDSPCWNCPKCHQDSLYRKSIVLKSE